MVEPGKQGTTQETPRVFTRGMLEYILFRFFYDEAETQPVQPLDNTAYPSYRILDPSGAILAQGVGVSSGQPGFWKIGWVVPRSAPITDNFRRYQFNSTMVDAQLRQFETSFEFDVVEGAIPAQQAFEQQFMSFTGVPIRLILSNTLRPVQLSVAFFLRGQDSNPLYVGHFVYPLPVPLPATNIMEVADNAGGFNYYIDVPGQSAGSYSAVWALRDTAVSQLDIEHQSVQVVDTTTMHRITSLRMLIDKLQKKLGLVFSYTNSDILEYLNRGGELVNSYWPPTNWSATTMPTPMEAFYILAGAWWGLTAQRILYAETNLNFCVDLETLLPTENGLIRAKDLILDQSVMMRRRISTQLIYGDEESLFDTICSIFGSDTRGQTIIDKLNLEQCSVSLGGLFTRFNLNPFKSFNSKGQPVWDIPSFRNHLETNYGMFYSPEEGLYENISTGLLTPYGYDVPKAVWYLKQKQVYRLENELGYELVATGNHPILTLNTTTFETQWKNLDEIEGGELIAITTNIPEKEDWEVSLEEQVQAVKVTNTCKTQSFFTLPNKMTPELARLCGYLIAEGCHTQYDLINFSNTNQDIISDFNYCCKMALGKEADFKGIGDNSESTFGGDNSLPLYKYTLYGVELRRFFFTLGFGYEKSPELRIPDVILRSPKYIAKEFIRGYFEGDGCFADNFIIFSSSSRKLLNDLQQLFLRFGIISKKDNPNSINVGKVTVRGLSLVKYADEIGFLFKGKEFQKNPNYYFPQREALNPEVLYGLMDLSKTLGLNKGWLNTPSGKKRYSVYWDHNARGPFKNGRCKYVTWKHIENWFEDRGEDIKELNPEIWNNIKLLLDTKFLWKKVTTLEKLDKRDVIDPSFESQGNLLDHAFITNGIITHNSGQTVTLDYNPGADIDNAISQFKEVLDNQVSKAKKQLLREARPVGTVATRPYRFRTNLVFPVSGNVGQALFMRLSNLGLTDWLS